MKTGTKKGSQRIMVPVNGSAADEAAVRMACGLARQSKGKVLLLNVVEIERNLPLDAAPEAAIVARKTALDQLQALCKEEKCAVEAEILQARETGPAIVTEAISREADLLVMGLSIHRHREVYGLGSVVPYVLKRAPCPV